MGEVGISLRKAIKESFQDSPSVSIFFTEVNIQASFQAN